jgi:hypothetical protein
MSIIVFTSTNYLFYVYNYIMIIILYCFFICRLFPCQSLFLLIHYFLLYIFTTALGATHRRDSIEVISIKSQLDLQPDGEIPHVTNWPLNLLFNSNRDDPSNIYCSPNKKLTVSDMLLYYKNNFTELIRTERLYLRGGKKDVSTPFISTLASVEKSENVKRKKRIFEDSNESDSLPVLSNNIKNNNNDNNNIYNNNNNNNNNINNINNNNHDNAYYKNNKNKNNKLKNNNNNKIKNKKFNHNKNNLNINNNINNINNKNNNNNNNNNNNKYMHRNNKFENSNTDDLSEYTETRRIRKIRKMQEIAKYMKNLHAEKIEYRKL